MKSKDIKFGVVIGMLVISCLFSWKLFFKTYSQTDTISVHEFPKQIDEWSAEELTITEEEYDILETKNVFARRYTTPKDEEVMLFIVYSENNRKVSHPPEICYTGAGVTVTKNTKESISNESINETIKTNKLFLEQGPSKQLSYYWFKVGDEFTSNYLKQQALIAIKSLLGQNASSALIRVSATYRDTEDKAHKDIVKFTKRIIPELKTYLP